MDEVGIPSIRELEKKAGVSNGTISTRKNQLKMPTVVIAEGLCRALRWTWIELWMQAGFIPPDAASLHLTAEEREALELLRALPREYYQAALAMLCGLVQNMAGRCIFVPVEGAELAVRCLGEAIRLNEEELYREAVLKVVGDDVLLRQKLGIDRKLDRMDAEDEARRGTGAEPGLMNRGAAKHRSWLDARAMRKTSGEQSSRAAAALAHVPRRANHGEACDSAGSQEFLT